MSEIEELLRKEKENAERILNSFFNIIVVTFVMSLIFLIFIIFLKWGL